MRRTILLYCMGFSTLVLAATQTQAQGRNCGPHDAVVAHLAERYAETRRMIGLSSNNTIIEVYAADGGSWTILVTTAGGASCIAAAGENFQAVNDTLTNTDPDA